jgi:hypothetical protein
MGSRPEDSNGRPEMAATIQRQRERLFKASAVIHTCRYACASEFERFEPERMYDVLRVVDELIDGAAAELEQFTQNEPYEGEDTHIPRVVAKSLRKDAALLQQQHPQLHTLRAQLLRAAAVIEELACGTDK